MTTTGTAQPREADLLLGRKCVWEFDPHTRGWKLVVDADVNITDIQIGAVEIKDHTTDDRAHVSADGLLHVFDHASTGAFVLVWVTYDYPEDSPFSNEDYGAFILGVRQHNIGSPVDAEGDFQGFIFNDQGQLHTYTSGSHTIADTELPDPIALTGSLGLAPIGPFAGALGYGFDSTAANRGWIPLQAADGGAGLAHPNSMLVTKAFMQAADAGGSLSYNVQVSRPNTDQEIWSSYPQLLQTAAVLYAYDGSGTFARLREGDLSDIYPNPTYAFEIGAFGMGYDPIEGLWERLNTDGSGRLRVETIWATGSAVAGPVDTELSAAVALSDNLANPTAGGVGAYTLAFEDDTDQWERVRGHSLSLGDGLDRDYFAHNMNVNAALWAINDALDVDRLRSEGASGSFAFRTSSYVETEDGFSSLINRTVIDWNERELVVFFSGSSVHADTELPAAAALSDGFANPTAPAVGAFNMFWDWDDTEWRRWYGAELNGDFNQVQIDKAPVVLSVLCGLEPTGSNFARLIARDDIPGMVQPLEVYTTGSFVMANTELPPAGLLADGMANPTAPAVASHLMGFNGVTWDRVYIGISGSVLVDLATRLDKINDEVTAYVTGTVGIDWPADGIGISGTVWVDTELPAAAALADATATPTAPAVGAFGLAYDEVDDTWDRMRQEGGSGSYALRTSEWVAGSGGYEELINKSVGAWSDRDLIVFHSGTHVTAVTGSAVNIHGQTRTIERSIINITGTAGEYMLITGVAGQQVKVTEVMAIVSADTELIFESGWTGTWKSGKLSVPADGDGFFCGACATPDQNHFETESGNMLVLRLVAGAQVGGWINWYYE